MTRRTTPDQTLEWMSQHDEALTVACPGPEYCCKPAGDSCVDYEGMPLVKQPAHHARRVAAAEIAGHQVDPLPAVAAAPDPTPAPRPASPAGCTEKDVCNHCGARLTWALTVNDKRMPVDAEPSPRGNIVLKTDGRGVWGAHVVGTKRQADALRANGYLLHLHHAVSCPYAARWATPKARGR